MIRPGPEDISGIGPWRRSLAAARANFAPGLVLQMLALAIVCAYYWMDPVQQALDRLAALRVRWGWWYSFLATSLFGGLIPFLYLRLHPATRHATPLSFGIFYLAFWGYKGLEVDALYRTQALLFGNAPDAATVALKVAVDQFVYNPLWSAPMALAVFLWKDLGFRFGRLGAVGWRGFFRDSLPPALIGTWAVWVPTVAVVYCLPAALQIPLFNIVLCFWVLMFTTLTLPGRQAG